MALAIYSGLYPLPIRDEQLPNLMNTSELQFNVIYTPGTVRYLTPFISTLLRWSDCRYRMVANGCSDDECDLLRAITALDDRLELLIMPEKRMVPHGETLDFLHARTDSDWFCFMDSDILAVGPFLEDFQEDLEQAEVFSSCLPLWYNEDDITLPTSFRHMHGIHAYAENGATIACDYFVIYNNREFMKTREATGVGLKVIAWNELEAEHQEALEKMGLKKADYDSGKALTMLMADRGARVRYRQSDNLKHIGGFTEVGAIEGALLFSRGGFDKLANSFPRPIARWLIGLADIWYVRKHLWQKGPTQNSIEEDYNLASRIRRRTTTARYFYLLIIGLVDDQPLPTLPLLGDAIAEQRIAIVTNDIADLVKGVRTSPGPWQDQ